MLGTTIKAAKDCFIGKNFNPRSRVGNDDKMANQEKMLRLFQSTFPCWERRYALDTYNVSDLFQSTFPCWERLTDVAAKAVTVKISIHVPVLGTTSQLPEELKEEAISIHVPVLGTTAKQYIFLSCFAIFLFILYKNNIKLTLL